MTHKYPDWICSECGNAVSKPVTELETWHVDDCDVCGERRPVCSARHYGYPALTKFKEYLEKLKK